MKSSNRQKLNIDLVERNLLQSSALNIYKDLEKMLQTINLLQLHKYQIINLNCNDWKNKQDIDKSFLNLGIDYSNCSNLDALKDCISELNVDRNTNMVIVLQNVDQMIQVFGINYVQSFIDVIALECRNYLLSGIKVIVMLYSKKYINFTFKFGGVGVVFQD